jgi:DNA repair protein RAD5
LEFTPEEQDIYDSLYKDSKIKFDHFCKAGTVLSKYASIFQLLVRLRQACNHPFLVLKGVQDNDTISLREDVDRTTLQQPEGLKDLIQKFATRLTQPDMLSQCSTPKSVQPSQGSYLDDMVESLFPMTQGLSKSNQTNNQSLNRECPICFDIIKYQDGVILQCMHTFCKQCIQEYMERQMNMGDLEVRCPTCNTGPIKEDDLIDLLTLPDLAQKENTPPSEITRPFEEKLVTNSDSSGSGRLRKSTKITHLLRCLEEAHKQDPTLKSVVFSQFTGMLDLVQESLEKAGGFFKRFVRFDGTMSQAKREKVLAEFKRPCDQKGASLMLISLRCGGVGLNLTMARTVYLLDPWWNYAVEEQVQLGYGSCFLNSFL